MRQISTCVSPPTTVRPALSSSFSSDDGGGARPTRGPSFVRPVSTGSETSPMRLARNSSTGGGASSQAGRNKDGGGGETKETHIHVLARIRPVEIHVQRQGFFDKANSNSNSSGAPANARRSRLPSPKSAISTPRKPSVPTRSSLATASTASSYADSSLDDGRANGDPNNLVAWEVSEDGDTAMQSEANTTLIQGRTHTYTLDKIYGTSNTTKDLYEESIRPLVTDAMEGYHSSILAYGQTSTGKTFTMTGTPDSPGLIPLCMRECFKQLKQSNTNTNRDFLFRLSYLEVYKEHIRDLLATSPQPIRLFENATTGLVIRGLNEVIVTSPEQIFKLLREGERRRQVGATHMNQHSSRSHVIVRLWIESSVAKSSTSASAGKAGSSSTTRISSLSLVDLAGSESVRLNGTQRREEGQYINKSLMTLGQVVLQLSEQSNGNGRYKQHIPYRDSKLTRLLQPSLSGNARMVLLCCISPLATHLEESHNTFKFATRAKKIKQKAVVNTTNAADGNTDTLLQSYRAEIEDLKQQLKEARREQQEALAASAANESTPSPGADDDEVHELVEAIQTMERLILKSRPNMQGSNASHASSELAPSRSTSELEFLLDDDNDVVAADADNEKKSVVIESLSEDGELLVEDPGLDRSRSIIHPMTPVGNENSSYADSDGQLHSELHRIRGLLGSVMKKRGMTPGRGSGTTVAERRKKFDFASPVREPAANDQEVQSLRKQLKEQEVTTNLRKADSTFLQRQLAEKDQLLEEIAKVLEAVEARQALLERENTRLRNELAMIKQQQPRQQHHLRHLP